MDYRWPMGSPKNFSTLTPELASGVSEALSTLLVFFPVLRKSNDVGASGKKFFLCSLCDPRYIFIATADYRRGNRCQICCRLSVCSWWLLCLRILAFLDLLFHFFQHARLSCGGKDVCKGRLVAERQIRFEVISVISIYDLKSPLRLWTCQLWKLSLVWTFWSASVLSESASAKCRDIIFNTNMFLQYVALLQHSNNNVNGQVQSYSGFN